MTRIVRKWRLLTFATTLALSGISLARGGHADSDLLRTRETVWRAWFAGDTNTLRRLVPEDAFIITSSEMKWKRGTDVLREAAEFHSEGGKLLKLEFPRTEVQRYGNVAIIYSEYRLEIHEAGKTTSHGGRVTEMFVRRHGSWLNTGWHTDSVKQ